MEFPQRKQNRLCDYDYSLNGAYFVTICTHERRKTLSEIVGDGLSVPKPYGTAAEEMIHPMPDHFHILPMIHRDFGTGNPSPTLFYFCRSKKVTSAKSRGHNCQGMKLLQAFLNSDSHGNSHTDHGVVTSAQEAHHFHMKAAFGVFLPTAGRDEPCLFLK